MPTIAWKLFAHGRRLLLPQVWAAAVLLGGIAAGGDDSHLDEQSQRLLAIFDANRSLYDSTLAELPGRKFIKKHYNSLEVDENHLSMIEEDTYYYDGAYYFHSVKSRDIDRPDAAERVRVYINTESFSLQYAETGGRGVATITPLEKGNFPMAGQLGGGGIFPDDVRSFFRGDMWTRRYEEDDNRLTAILARKVRPEEVMKLEFDKTMGYVPIQYFIPGTAPNFVRKTYTDFREINGLPYPAKTFVQIARHGDLRRKDGSVAVTEVIDVFPQGAEAPDWTIPEGAFINDLIHHRNYRVVNAEDPRAAPFAEVFGEAIDSRIFDDALRLLEAPRDAAATEEAMRLIAIRNEKSSAPNWRALLAVIATLLCVAAAVRQNIRRKREPSRDEASGSSHL